MFKIKCEGKVVDLKIVEINGKQKSFTKKIVTLEHNSNYKGQQYTKYVDISSSSNLLDQLEVGNEVIIEGYTESKYYEKKDGSQGNFTINTASQVFIKNKGFTQITEEDVPY